MAPVAPSASALPSAPPLPSSVAPAVVAPSFPFSLGDRRLWAPGSSLGTSGSSGVPVAPAVPVCSVAPVSAPSVFRPFASDLSPSSSSLPVSSALPPPGFSGPPPGFYSSFSFPDSSAPPPDPSSSFAFGSEDLPEDSPPDAVPRVLDPGAPVAFPDSVRSEFRRMMAGSPSVPPPPRALFEDFFSSPTLSSSPIFLNWFGRVRSALEEANSRLASFVTFGLGDFLFLPSWSSTYAVHGDFALGGAAPVNPSLLSLFERRLKLSNHVGMSISEAAALQASLRSQSEALSHLMWVLSALLAFVRLQNFAPEDSSLFNTLVTSLSRSLAHQASLTVTHTAFVGLKRCSFYLSHFPAYFFGVNKWSMLSSPLVLASSLFSDSDISRLLADTQTSSSLCSQQALVDVVSRGAGARSHRSSPFCSPSRSSPSHRKRWESGTPACSGKRVRLDSPAPNSALKGLKAGFRR